MTFDLTYIWSALPEFRNYVTGLVPVVFFRNSNALNLFQNETAWRNSAGFHSCSYKGNLVLNIKRLFFIV